MDAHETLRAIPGQPGLVQGLPQRSQHAEQRVDIPVTGMTCAHCAQHITAALQKVPGVQQASVNQTTGLASITYEPAHMALADLLAVIRAAGYTPGSARIRLSIKGMTCASCVTAVEAALQQTPGVVAATVNAGTAQAAVDYLPTLVDVQGLTHAVAASGYEAVEPAPATEEGISQEDRSQQHEYRTLMRKFWFAAAISIPVMALSYPDLIPGLRDSMPMGSLARRLVWSLLGVLVLPVMLWSGSQFYTGMWAALKHRAANMHTLR